MTYSPRPRIDWRIVSGDREGGRKLGAGDLSRSFLYISGLLFETRAEGGSRAVHKETKVRGFLAIYTYRTLTKRTAGSKNDIFLARVELEIPGKASHS